MTPSRAHFGVCPLESIGNVPKPTLTKLLGDLSGLKNYSFFDFQKKFVLLHANSHLFLIFKAKR